MTCNDTTLSLGVYLLGALNPAERALVEQHLADCADCRAELNELAGLPSMLEQLSLEDIAPEPMPPSEDLFERVAQRARAEQAAENAPRLARYRRMLAVAAAAVVITGAGVGSWAALRSPSPGTQTATNKVQMHVTLASETTGTGLTVTVSGLPADEHCRLIAVARDGSRDVAGQWDATYKGWAQETGSTVIPRSQLVKLVLLGTHGEHLATVPV